MEGVVPNTVATGVETAMVHGVPALVVESLRTQSPTDVRSGGVGLDSI